MCSMYVSRNAQPLFRNVFREHDSPLCFRSVSGVDVDPDLVHMEMQDTSGGTVTFQSAHLSVPFLFMRLVTPAQTQMDSL